MPTNSDEKWSRRLIMSSPRSVIFSMHAALVAAAGDRNRPLRFFALLPRFRLDMRDWSRGPVSCAALTQPATDAGRPEKDTSTRAVHSENPEFLPITY